MAAEGFDLGLASLLRETAGARPLPPVGSWNPRYCGTIDIHIRRDGIWLHEGVPFRRPELLRLFSTILRREQDGFYLVTPAEKLRIQVDDAPFLAVLLRTEGEGVARRLIFTTNVGDEFAADADHPIRVEARQAGEPAPYVHVRNGLEARIARNVFYELAELAVPAETDSDMLGVWSTGLFFPLGRAA